VRIPRRSAAVAERMRRTWDAAAGSGEARVLGTGESAERQVERILSLLGPAPDGMCLEVGCGDGRMTVELARRFAGVLAVDVSPLMLERAAQRGLENVRLQRVSGLALDGVPDRCAAVVVCYGVLQHLPRKALVARLLAEVARTLAPDGKAVVHLPVLAPTVRARSWRLARAAAVSVRARLSRGFDQSPAYQGVRLTEAELRRALRRAGLRDRGRLDLPSYFPHAANVLLRLEHDVR